MATSAAAPTDPFSTSRKFEAQSNEILRLVEQLVRRRWALHLARTNVEAIEKSEKLDWAATAEMTANNMEVEMHKRAISLIAKCIENCASERIDV